jgi:hypothetical protein
MHMHACIHSLSTIATPNQPEPTNSADFLATPPTPSTAGTSTNPDTLNGLQFTQAHPRHLTSPVSVGFELHDIIRAGYDRLDFAEEGIEELYVDLNTRGKGLKSAAAFFIKKSRLTKKVRNSLHLYDVDSAYRPHLAELVRSQ